MKTPCCNKEINEDEIFNLIYEDNFGVTNKDFNCPYCSKLLTAFLNIESLELGE